MEQIKTVEIKDICLGIYEGPHATPKNSDTGGIYLGIPALDPKGFIDYSRAKRIAEEDLPLWTKRVTPQEDDIVFTNEATLNLYAIIPANFHGCLGRRLGLIRPNKDLVNVKYLFYYFFSPEWRETVAKNKVSGATVDRILMTKFPSFPVALPSLKTQERIANILSVIDAKIELNRQINDNLEQQAQAAFNNIIANTTSDKTVQLSEIAWLNPKRSISKGKVARSIEMAHLPTTGSFPSGWEMKEYNGGMKFQNGDTLMARITPCLENGKVAFVNFLDDDEIAFGSTEYITMTPKRQFAPEVLYFLVRNAEFIDFAVKNMNGSSGRQRVSADTIGTFELPDITLEELHMLETIAREALTKIKYNSLENMRLAEMRDTLLPKLMSGELKINEIDC